MDSVNITDKTELLTKFSEIYGEGGETAFFFAPGIVNLMGDYTDFNGGHVFPCALDFGTAGVIRKRTDDRLNFFSLNFSEDGIISCCLNDLTPSDGQSWTDYPKGIFRTFQERGFKPDCGADIFIAGNIPLGASLSSSASIEVLTAIMIRDTYGFTNDLTRIDLAEIGQYSENHFNGIRCGIMGQFASAMGKKDNAIFLHAKTLHFQYAPFKLDAMRLVIANTNVRHVLLETAYNKRHEECAQALNDLKKLIPIKNLCDILGEQFEEYRTLIHDPVIRKRAKHVIYDNQRTIQASSALAAGNLRRFGLLMKDSHISLRDDFEVSCPELDFLASLAWEQPSCIGSRMTGAGFGGCTVSIVREDGLEDFIHVLGEAYEKEFGKKADFYVAGVNDGVRAL
jgi:galactokinase